MPCKKGTMPGPNDTTLDTYQPAMSARAAEIVNRMVDLIAYIDQRFDENGQSVRRFITRRTQQVVAGSRLPYLEPVIPFSYDDLIDAIGRAIDEQEKRDGAKVVDTVEREVIETLDFKTIREEASNLWNKLVNGDPEKPNEEMARAILKKAEIAFGRPIKLSEITEDQVDIFNILLQDMKDLAKGL